MAFDSVEEGVEGGSRKVALTTVIVKASKKAR